MTKKIEFKVSHREFVAGAERNCPHCNLSVPLHETDPSGPKVTGEYAITIPYEKTCPHCKKTFNTLSLHRDQKNDAEKQKTMAESISYM